MSVEIFGQSWFYLLSFAVVMGGYTIYDDLRAEQQQ